MNDHKETDKLMQIIDTQSILASAEFNLAGFMNIVVNRMQALTPATGAVVELLEGEEMVYKAASGSVAPYVNLRLNRADSLSGLCVTDREIKLSVDTADDSRVDAAACQKVGAASMVCVPLFQRGESMGVLKIVSSRPNAFSEADIQTLRLMAGLLGGALGQQLEMEQRRELEEKLRHVAQHDVLTQLPNRALFYDRLQQAILRSVRNKSILGLLYLDIDYFKNVNDTHGHDVGDKLLQSFSSRIRNLFRATDTFARLGGDEFTLEPDELIRQADSALYEAKRAGRNGFKISVL